MHALRTTGGIDESTDAAQQLKADFRDGMARLGAAVTIVTTDGPAGRAGFAATAVCSVSDNPPTLLVCLNRASSAHAAVSENGVVCVNVTHAGQKDVCGLFGGKTPMAARFEGGTWTKMISGAPALDEALVSFDCRISSVVDGGTHDVLFCEVLGVRDHEGGNPLIYFARGYHQLPA